MKFKRKMRPTQEEQDYINGVVGYSLAKEKDYLIYSETERIYRLIIQFYNPNPDCPQDEIHIILYKGAIIKLTYSYYKEGDVISIYYISIIVPFEVQDEEDKIIEIIKDTEDAIEADEDGTPSQDTITYPNGFPLTYSDEITIPVI